MPLFSLSPAFPQKCQPCSRTKLSTMWPDRTADQSIQAGDGGWGWVLDAQAYRRIRKLDTQFYIAGVYLFNPMGTNDAYTFRSFPRLHHREDYMSIADQYLFRSGFGHAVPKIRGLAASFGAR